MTDIILSTQNGEPVASSRQIAENFEKNHRDVLKAIETLEGGLRKTSHTPMFYKTEYTHEQNGQTYPMYLMNRDGFSLLVMGFTGKAALEWKLKYIAAFNEMEKQLAQRPQLSRSELMAQALIAAHEELEEKDKRIAELTPDAEFARAVCVGKNCRTTTSLSKDYGLSAEKLNSILHGLKIQYKTSDGQWVLYTKYCGKGYTKNRKSTPFQHKSTGKWETKNTTVWTEAGQRFIYEQLKAIGLLPKLDSKEAEA
jgi:Rha family phage regulatory protein